MFRRQENTMTADPRYPADLKKLGYFVDNSTYGCIRNIKAPELFFDFYYTNEDRHNQVRGEAMRTCQREEVLNRLSALGLKLLYLPTLTNVKPNGPHIPILAPPADVLKERKRVIVIINDDCYQDLGILAYRELQRDLGINGGSVVNFAKSIICSNPSTELSDEVLKDGVGVKQDDRIPGLIVMNTGQLLYSHKYNTALSVRSWTALPRKSISHDAIIAHPIENRVKGHRTPEEHIKSVFDKVINNPHLVSQEAEVYVIAIENGFEKLFECLKEDGKYAHRITAMAVIHSHVNNYQITSLPLKRLLHTRARHWKVGDGHSTDPTKCVDLPSDYDGSCTPAGTETKRKPVNWFEVASTSNYEGSRDNTIECHAAKSLHCRVDQKLKTDQESESAESFLEAEADPICPTFPGGDTWVGECVFTQTVVQQAIMAFFEEVAQDPVNYRNPDFKLDKSNVPEPTPDNPLTLSAPDGGLERTQDSIQEGLASAELPSLPDEMLTPEQQTLISAKLYLQQMELALDATPCDDASLIAGRKGLEKRISEKEAEIEELEKQALATGSLGAGASRELREKWDSRAHGEKWTPEKMGSSIPFAGTRADSEVMKRAGLSDTVEEELERMGLEDN